MTITLTDNEFDSLLICLGYAVGAAWPVDRQLAVSFMRVVNAVNRDNPQFRPYVLPFEEPDERHL
jgi:hypothetical protein